MPRASFLAPSETASSLSLVSRLTSGSRRGSRPPSWALARPTVACAAYWALTTRRTCVPSRRCMSPNTAPHSGRRSGRSARAITCGLPSPGLNSQTAWSSPWCPSSYRRRHRRRPRLRPTPRSRWRGQWSLPPKRKSWPRRHAPRCLARLTKQTTRRRTACPRAPRRILSRNSARRRRGASAGIEPEARASRNRTVSTGNSTAC